MEQVLFTAIGNWLQSIIAGIQVIQGQGNRTPEPQATEFIVMTPILKPRLSTNIHEYNDCQFTGVIAGNTLTVSNIKFGKLTPGNQVFGPSVADNTQITGQASGPIGGAGNYTLNGAPQTVAGETMASGTETITGPTQVDVQLDVHSASLINAGEMANKIVTLFRDERAVDFFQEGYPGIAPLYADDPTQVPFINAEDQYESRYVITARFQVNSSIVLPQQFADELQVTLEPVG